MFNWYLTIECDNVYNKYDLKISYNKILRLWCKERGIIINAKQFIKTKVCKFVIGIFSQICKINLKSRENHRELPNGGRA